MNMSIIYNSVMRQGQYKNSMKTSVARPNVQIKMQDSSRLTQSPGQSANSSQKSSRQDLHCSVFCNRPSSQQVFELQNQVYELRSTINNLCIKNETMASELNRQQGHSTDLNKQKNRLEEELRKSVVTNNELERIVQNLRRKIKGQSKDVYQIITAQSSTLSELPKIINFGKIRQNPSQIQVFMQQSLLLRNENERLGKLINDLQNENKSLRSQLFQLQENKRVLSSEHNEDKAKEVFQLITTHEKELSSLKGELKRLTVQNEELKLQLKFSSQRCDQFQQRNAYFRKELEMKGSLYWKASIAVPHEKQMNKENEQLNKCKNQIQKLQIANEEVNNLLHSSQHKLQLKEKQLRQQKQLCQDLFERNQLCEKQYKQLQQVYFKQERELTNLLLTKDQATSKFELTIKTLRSEVDALKEQNCEITKQKALIIKNLEAQISILEFSSETQTEKRRNQTFKSEIVLLQNQNRTLKSQSRELSEKNQRLIKNSARSEQERRNQKKLLQAELQFAKDNFDKKSQQQINLLKNCKRTQKEVQRLQQKLLSTEQQLFSQRSKCQQLKSNSNVFEKKMKQHDDRIRKLCKENSSLAEKNTELEEKLTTLDEVYTRLEGKYKKDILQMNEKMNKIVESNEKRSKSKSSRNSSMSVNSHHHLSCIEDRFKKPQQDNSFQQVSSQVIKKNSKSQQHRFKRTPDGQLAMEPPSRDQNVKPRSAIAPRVTIQHEGSTTERHQKITPRPPCTNDRLKSLLEKVERKLQKSRGKQIRVQHLFNEEQIRVRTPPEPDRILHNQKSKLTVLYEEPNFQTEETEDYWISPKQKCQQFHNNSLPKVPTFSSILPYRKSLQAQSRPKPLSVESRNMNQICTESRRIPTEENNSERRWNSKQTSNYQTALSMGDGPEKVSSPILNMTNQINSDRSYLLLRNRYHNTRNSPRSISAVASLDEKIKKIKEANSELRQINFDNSDQEKTTVRFQDIGALQTPQILIEPSSINSQSINSLLNGRKTEYRELASHSMLQR